MPTPEKEDEYEEDESEMNCALNNKGAKGII